MSGIVTPVIAQSSGTWTPLATFETPGDFTISSTAFANGLWIRQGSLVFIECSYRFTPSYTTATGRFRIGGLPFVVYSSGNAGNGFPLINTQSGLSWNSRTMLTAVAIPGTQYCQINGMQTGANMVEMAVAQVPTATQQTFNFSGTYRAV